MREKVLAVCEEVCEGVDLSSTNLIDGKLLDSVTLMALLDALMEEFDVEIPYKEVTAKNFNSVDAITALIEKYQE